MWGDKKKKIQAALLERPQEIIMKTMTALTPVFTWCVAYYKLICETVKVLHFYSF